jgi:hypothetical protein
LKRFTSQVLEAKVRHIVDHIVSGDQAVQLSIRVTDEPGAGGANHRYEISGFCSATNPSTPNYLNPADDQRELMVLFQNGPIKEFGVNGITGEALLAIEIDRLRSFQKGPYACADNRDALGHCEAALYALQRRTLARIARGVEGTHAK